VLIFCAARPHSVLVVKGIPTSKQKPTQQLTARVPTRAFAPQSALRNSHRLNVATKKQAGMSASRYHVRSFPH
jgi:hypothetical protein